MLLTVAMVATLLVGEAAVRLIRPQQLIVKRPDLWVPHDSLGWTHRPHLNTKINTGEGTVTLVTDSLGFRSDSTSHPNPSRRILMLGDSFMEALQVEYDESVAGRLERELETRTGAVVAVRNTGVGGWGPHEYAFQAGQLLGREPYDLVLVSLYLGNDIVERDGLSVPTPVEEHSFRIPRKLSRRELIDALLYPVNDFLEVRSHLFILMKTGLSTLLMKWGLTAAYFPEIILRRQASSPRWETTARICRRIVDLAARHGVPTVVALVPAPYQVDRASFEDYVRGFDIDTSAVDLSQPNRLMAESLRSARVDFVDVTPAVSAIHARGERPYGRVDRHFTAQGHAAMTTAILPKVVAVLQGEKVGPRVRVANRKRQ